MHIRDIRRPQAAKLSPEQESMQVRRGSSCLRLSHFNRLEFGQREDLKASSSRWSFCQDGSDLYCRGLVFDMTHYDNWSSALLLISHDFPTYLLPAAVVAALDDRVVQR